MYLSCFLSMCVTMSLTFHYYTLDWILIYRSLLQCCFFFVKFVVLLLPYLVQPLWISSCNVVFCSWICSLSLMDSSIASSWRSCDEAPNKSLPPIHFPFLCFLLSGLSQHKLHVSPIYELSYFKFLNILSSFLAFYCGIICNLFKLLQFYV